MMRTDQAEKMTSGPGFVAALDQSGGSTPKALKLYGIDENAYSNDDQMFDLIHQMRCRIMQSPSFNGNKVIGAILFENTMDREVAGKSAADFLWEERRIVPFLKVDKGLADENNGVQLMKPMPELESLLKRATAAGIFDLDTDSNGRWSVEKFKGLMFQIEREANAIAKDTRRGKGLSLIHI